MRFQLAIAHKAIYAEPDLQSALGAWARQLRNLDSVDYELVG